MHWIGLWSVWLWTPMAGAIDRDSQPQSAPSPPSTAQKTIDKCDVPLWTNDPDPSGLNVRQTPERHAPIVGALPPEAMFTAVEARHGRFRIKSPMVWNWPEAERIPLKKGPQKGWVYGGLVSIDTTCRRDKSGRAVMTVYTAPDESSPAVVTWVAGQDYACDWHIDKALDCSGKWLKAVLKKKPGAKAVSGWLHPETLCDNPLTTCGGY